MQESTTKRNGTTEKANPKHEQMPEQRSAIRERPIANMGLAALTTIGVSAAAAYASTRAPDKGVGIAAWVAVAVVGAASTIAAARNS
jgi:hypothetical protein